MSVEGIEDAEAKLRQLEAIEGTVLVLETRGAVFHADPSLCEVRAIIEEKEAALRKVLQSPDTEVAAAAASVNFAAADDAQSARNVAPNTGPEASSLRRDADAASIDVATASNARSAQKVAPQQAAAAVSVQSELRGQPLSVDVGTGGDAAPVDICQLSLRMRSLDPAMASMKPICDMLNAMYVDEHADLKVTRHILSHMTVLIHGLDLPKDLVDQLQAVVDAKRGKMLELEAAAQREAEFRDGSVLATERAPLV